ncbi:MAG: ABC transporter permease, partial [Acidobacteria bacterium]|nr:ABC transporter permease [Acidobacteriota bacterium]
VRLGAGGRIRMARMVGGPSQGDRPESLTWETQAASSDYFDVLRLRLRSGRVFTHFDGAGSPRVVVVNETFAREVLGGEPAVGQRVQVGFGSDSWEVIGVVADVRNRGLTGTRPPAAAFVPVLQMEAGPVTDAALFIVVRTTGDPLAVVPFLREAVADAHPRAAIEDMSTMNARLWAAVVQPRFYAVFAGCFAALALFLAAFGVYGLLSYTVSQRRREIGVRMALGAQRGDVVGLVVRQGAALVTAGAVLGLVAAAASSRVLEIFLYGVGTDDRLTFVAGPLVLVVAALVACWLPARRATRIDPVQALRVE